MPSIRDSYVDDLHEHLGYLGTWLPNTRLELGDIGELNGAEFRRHSSLADLGIRFRVRRDGQAARLAYTSSDAVELSFKVKGDAPLAGSALVEGRAGLSVQFS